MLLFVLACYCLSKLDYFIFILLLSNCYWLLATILRFLSIYTCLLFAIYSSFLILAYLISLAYVLFRSRITWLISLMFLRLSRTMLAWRVTLICRVLFIFYRYWVIDHVRVLVTFSIRNYELEWPWFFSIYS